LPLCAPDRLAPFSVSTPHGVYDPCRPCLSVAGKRIDETIAAEMLRAVAPMAIEAAEEAERMLRDEDQDRRRIAELELQQAQYDASLAERRYAACDPDNRLIAAQLEKAWETAGRSRVAQRRNRAPSRLETHANRMTDLASSKQWIHYLPIETAVRWAVEAGLILVERRNFVRWQIFGQEMAVFRNESPCGSEGQTRDAARK